MAQVTAFVRQAIPTGLDGAGSDRIDPVARLAAFNSSVRPRLSSESEQYRFNCFNLLSTGLGILPFSPAVHPSAGTDPATVSVFAAKVQSVSGLAVDDGSRDLLTRAGGLATAYQSLLVATKLMGSSHPERYHLIQQNYSTAASAIESTKKWPALAIRLSGLSRQCQAVDLWLSGGKPKESRKVIGEALAELQSSRSQLAASPEIGYMLPAVDQELSVVRMVTAMLDIAENSPTVAPDPLTYVQRLMGVLDWLVQHLPPDWAPAFRSAKLREEILRRASWAREAQAGRRGVKVVLVGSGVLIPFWVVELPYTFETGMLWAKKGKEVPETMLVAATFPTDLSCFAGMDSGRVLTDIFSLSPGPRNLDSHYNRIRGREQKISDSGNLFSVVQGASMTTISAQKAVPPFSSEPEALRLVQIYLDAIRASNPRAASQLRSVSPRISDLVYIPCSTQPGLPIPWLGPLSPTSIGDPGSLVGFSGPA